MFPSHDPGSISPVISRPYHYIMMIRVYPHPGNETTGFWKWQDANRMRYIKGNLDSSIDIDLYQDMLWEIQFDGSGNWVISVDGVADTSGSGEAPTANEWWTGSNGHPMEFHFRFGMWKFGSFSAQDLSTIRTNAATIWPKGMPLFPVLDTVYQLASSQWNTSISSWDLYRNKTVTFTGGNGTAGTHTYQWYYWDSNDSLGSFPTNNRLDYQRPLTGADDQNRS